jgi:hypothetical protein
MATLADSVSDFIIDSGLAHEIVHGGINTTVMTEGGPVKSFAKLQNDNTTDYQDALTAAVNAASSAAADAALAAAIAGAFTEGNAFDCGTITDTVVGVYDMGDLT